METVELLATRCAICRTPDWATELYPANFDVQALNPAVFSARRLPDRIHYRLVKCQVCGLVRSDPIADPALLAQLYQQSAVTYTEEVGNLKQTYGDYLSRLAAYGVRQDTLLEIGCGNGFFLEAALAQGYLNVHGVEPSRAGVASANPRVRSKIVCDVMRPGLFAPGQFDAICMFQVLDHIPDPAGLLEECLQLLKPGGLVLCINHNVEAWSARLLKNRSPIIDIEHTFLYSPPTITFLFEAHGFKVRQVGSVYNRYTLYYLLRLMPLSGALKAWLLDVLESSRLGRLPVCVPLGNLWAVAQKPDDASWRK